MSELLFEYKIMCNGKEIKLYSTTDIEEFLVRNNTKYVRNITDTLEHRLLKEIERLQRLLDIEKNKRKQFDKNNQLLHSIIKEVREKVDNFDVFKEFTFPLMKRDEEQQVKSSINYEWRKSIKEPILEILDKVGNE